MNTLTVLLITNTALCILFALLIYASWIETKKQHIPRVLIYIGCAAGIALNTLLPKGLGFVSYQPGAIGFWKSFIGMLLGLTLLLPLFWLGIMNTAETKLMAMVGAFLGPAAVIGVAIISYISGAFLFLIFFLRGQSAKRMLNNVNTKMIAGLIHNSMYELSTMENAYSTKKPYAMAIAFSCFVYFAFSGFEKTEYIYLFNLF